MAKGKGKWKGILATIAIVAALGMSTGALIRTISNEKTKELPSSAYSIGAVTDEGKLDSEDKTSITSDKLNVKDLVSVEKEEDAGVDVYVHYYNEDGEFLQTVEVVEGEELPQAPEGAETCRIEIVPTDDDDGKIGIFEKGDYAGMVKVTLKK